MALKTAAGGTMQRLQEDIRNKTFQPCYLLYGTESYLIRQYRQNLAEAVIPDGNSMNLSSFSDKVSDLQTIIDLADTMPFFSEYRLIILEDTGLFHESCDLLADYMAHIPETTIFLFTEYPSNDPKKPTKNIDRRGRLYKAVSKYGYAAELNTPSDADLVKWVAGQIRREQKKISDHTLRLFLSRNDADMNRIRNSLDKLLSYSMDAAQITDADVEAVCGPLPEDRVFQMVDAISLKNRQKAFTLYADLTALRTPAGRILYLISDQYANLLHVKELRAKGMNALSIREETGLRDFVVDKCSRIAERYTQDELKACLSACVQAEEAYKTGKINDQLSLELLIAELSA